MPGKDENLPKDLGTVIGNCELIINAFGASSATTSAPRGAPKSTSA
jgi:hypothetical protein